MTLNEVLGTLPNGKVLRLTDDQLTKFLRDKYNTDSEARRKASARRRLDLYRDKGRRHFERAIERVFKNQVVREWRKTFLEFSEFQNVTKRVVREISTVYSESAKRSVVRVTDDERYQLFQRTIRQDRIMRKVNLYGNLLNNVLVWPDVYPDGDRLVAVQRVVTPDKFSAIAHPNDPARAVGFVVERFPNGFSTAATEIHFLVIGAEELITLDKDWRMVGRVSHGWGRMPVILWSRQEPDDCILDGTSGEDLISAHMAVALLNTMMLKHQKSGTRMAIATGDTSGMARGQPMDEETLIEAPEGVGFQTLDLGADPRSYIEAVRAVIKQVAANYGIPEAVFDLNYQASSGFEIELKRVGLREIRRDQIMDFRIFERELAELWSFVLQRNRHPLAFDVTGWSINFGEYDTPQDPIAKLDYWEKMESMGLANRIEMYLVQNPEADEVQAREAIERNLELKIAWMRDLQRANGGLFGPAGSENQPQGSAVGESVDFDQIAEDTLAE